MDKRQKQCSHVLWDPVPNEGGVYECRSCLCRGERILDHMCLLMMEGLPSDLGSVWPTHKNGEFYTRTELGLTPGEV